MATHASKGTKPAAPAKGGVPAWIRGGAASAFPMLLLARAIMVLAAGVGIVALSGILTDRVNALPVDRVTKELRIFLTVIITAGAAGSIAGAVPLFLDGIGALKITRGDPDGQRMINRGRLTHRIMRYACVAVYGLALFAFFLIAGNNGGMSVLNFLIAVVVFGLLILLALYTVRCHGDLLELSLLVSGEEAAGASRAAKSYRAPVEQTTVMLVISLVHLAGLIAWIVLMGRLGYRSTWHTVSQCTLAALALVSAAQWAAARSFCKLFDATHIRKP